MSADITLMSVAPRPWSAADRPLDVVPIHFHKEVRTAQRFARAKSHSATLAARAIDGAGRRLKPPLGRPSLKRHRLPVASCPEAGGQQIQTARVLR
jgi:hypothetical protein